MSSSANRHKPKESKPNPTAGSSGSSKRPKAEENDKDCLRKKHKFIRTTIRTDYQPDICKDYKNTGFCGFGDSCKFLHDRSDYKPGWQIDQEWEKGQYEDEDDEKYLIENSDDEGDDDEDDANKCAICKEEYKDPVITKCKHIFCSDCADKECVTKCFSCEKPTSGIFKNASKLIKL